MRRGRPLSWRSESRPTAAELREQSERLAGLRSKLLRRVRVAGRQRVLDLGAGHGAVTGELARRGGAVVAVDAADDFLDLDPTPFAGAERVRASASALPFRDESFDLVFCQLGLLWMGVEALDEVRRVLAPGGAFAGIEPDYGGLLEWPRGGGDEAVARLRASGADVEVGRKVPGRLAELGFRGVRAEVLSELDGRSGGWGLLGGSDEERGGEWERLRWVPMVGVTGER